jgi:hypothetical protein
MVALPVSLKHGLHVTFQVEPQSAFPGLNTPRGSELTVNVVTPLAMFGLSPQLWRTHVTASL